VKRAVFLHRVPKIPRQCFDCLQAIVDGLPYERIRMCYTEDNGDTVIASDNLCLQCWQIHCWLTKEK